MARRLAQSISEMLRRMGCPRSAGVRICQQWSEEGQPPNWRQLVGQASGGGVMLWAYLNIITYLNIVADPGTPLHDKGAP